MDEMTPRERFHAVMDFEPFDRLPVTEWAVWWGETIERWRAEGLPLELTDRYDICRHFGLEVYKQHWFPPCGPACPSASHYGAGILSDETDYDALRQHMYPWPAVDGNMWGQWAGEQKRGEVVLWFTVEGFFWFPRGLLGIENHYYALYDQPGLIHRINSDLADYHVRIIEEICRICTPDFMTFAEDMSYNHGPMLSRELFEEFLAPYYRRVVPLLKERGIIPFVDSDGDVTVLAEWLQEVGIEGILPLERQAGVDVARLRQLYPRMRWIGAFDKMTMNRGEAAMRAEFERLLPTASQGGLIVGCDHQTPPGVSYDQYKLYVRLLREYAEKAATSATLRPG